MCQPDCLIGENCILYLWEGGAGMVGERVGWTWGGAAVVVEGVEKPTNRHSGGHQVLYRLTITCAKEVFRKTYLKSANFKLQKWFKYKNGVELNIQSKISKCWNVKKIEKTQNLQN